MAARKRWESRIEQPTVTAVNINGLKSDCAMCRARSCLLQIDGVCQYATVDARPLEVALTLLAWMEGKHTKDSRRVSIALRTVYSS